MSDKPIGARLQTASDPATAFRQYDELRKLKRVKRALIIAELTNDQYRVLGQIADPTSMAQLCYVAAQALGQLPPDMRDQPEGDATVTDDTPIPGPPPAETPEPPEPPRRHRAGMSVYSIAAGWAAFDQQTVPSEAAAAQRRALRRTWYASAGSLFDTMMRMLDPGDDEMTATDEQRMLDLDSELRRFAEDVRAGRA